MITVTIRGSDDDVQDAKKKIEELTVDLLIAATPQNPVEPKQYEIIDWKAAAMQCVNSFLAFRSIVELKSNFIYFHRMKP